MRYVLRISYIVLCFLVYHIACSQEISNIQFKGLKRTKPSYLLQFLEVNIGDEVDSVLIKKDLQTLKNLQLFNEAQFVLHDSLERITLVYKVKEVVTRLPIVGLGWTDAVFWSELGGMDLNALGKGIKCVLKYRLYERNSYMFFMRNAHLNSSRWGYEVMVNRLATIEPLYFKKATRDYFYNNNSVGLGGLYWFTRKVVSGVYTQFIHEKYEKTLTNEKEVIGLPSGHTTNKLLLKLSLQINKVDYQGARLNGFYNYLAVESIYSKNTYERFLKWSNEFKVFKFIGGKGNIGARLRMGVSSNNNTPFASFVADNYVNIRGVGDRAVRGTAEIAGNLEYRQLIFTHPSLCIATVGFTDLGTWRLPGANLATIIDKGAIRVYSGVGLRLHLLMLYSAVLRVDYSFNMHDTTQRGLVMGVGQYF